MNNSSSNDGMLLRQHDGDDDSSSSDDSSRFSLPSPDDLILGADDEEVRASIQQGTTKTRQKNKDNNQSENHENGDNDDDSTCITRPKRSSDVSISTSRSGSSRTDVYNVDDFRGMSQDKLLEYSTNRLRSKLSKRTNCLVGREKEISEIEQAFSYVCTNRHTAVVWISGRSGTGKSFLANQLNISHHPYHSSSSSHKRKKRSLRRWRQQRRMRKKQGSSNSTDISTRTASDTISHESTGSNSKKRISMKLPKQKRQERTRRYFFSVASKFDLQFVNEPFACIKFALTDLANQILTLPRQETTKGKTDGTTNDEDFDAAETSSSGSAPREYSYYFEDIQQQLLSGLGEEPVRLLSSFIPNLTDILVVPRKEDKQESTENYASHSSSDGEKVQNLMVPPSSGYKELSDQLKFALQRFLQIVANFCPLVWIADDLHWADEASLEMIRTWILDIRITSFLVVACYRCDVGRETKSTDEENVGASDVNDVNDESKTQQSNESGEESRKDDPIKPRNGSRTILDEIIEAVEQVCEERKVKITNIWVDNFSLKQVNEMLSETLAESTETTHELAKVVFRKTYGNIFFTIQLLLNLSQQGLLRFNSEALKWEWDDENKIQGLVATSANVIELMKSKLTQIPQARFSLPLAACLGASFSWDTLKIVLDGFRVNDEAWRSYCTSIFGVTHNGQEDGEGNGDKGSLTLEQAPARRDASFYTDDVMELCVDHGLLQSTREEDDEGAELGGTYCFVHDKIQEAALALLPDEKLPAIQFRVGQILLTKFPKDELDQNCFLVANLINPCLHLISRDAYGEMQRLDLVRLNYLAGMKAVERSAFLSALSFFSTSISLLPANHWKEYRNFCLDLYLSSAECSYVIGDFEKTQCYCSQILDMKEHAVTILEKLRVYYVLIECSLSRVMVMVNNDHDNDDNVDDNNMNNDKTDDTKETPRAAILCFEALRDLGCTFPKSTVMLGLSTVKGLFTAKKNAQTTWTEELVNRIPMSDDEKVIATTKILAKLTVVAYSWKPEILPLIIVKNVNMTFDVGLTIYSPPAFASLGLIVACFMGDFKTGERLALHSLRLVSRLRTTSRIAEAQTIFTAYSTVLHWTKPFHSCRVPFLEAYQIGMRMGDPLAALWSAHYYCEFSFNIGTPSLPLIDAETVSFSKIADDYGQEPQRDILLLFRQVVLNLRGMSPNKVILTGDDFNGQEMLDRYVHSHHQVMPMHVHRIKLITMIYFDAYEECARLILEHGDEILERVVGQVGCLYTVYYGALGCYVASRLPSSLPSSSPPRGGGGLTVASDEISLSPTSGAELQQQQQQEPRRQQQRTYLAKAKKYRNKLKAWSKKGNPNCHHMVSILDAEHILSTTNILKSGYNICNNNNKKEMVVIQAYQDAIEFAEKLGMIQDQALANERLAEFCIQQR